MIAAASPRRVGPGVEIGPLQHWTRSGSKGRTPPFAERAVDHGPDRLRAGRDLTGERARRPPFQSKPASYCPWQAQTACAEGTAGKSPRTRMTSSHLWSAV